MGQLWPIFTPFNGRFFPFKNNRSYPHRTIAIPAGHSISLSLFLSFAATSSSEPSLLCGRQLILLPFLKDLIKPPEKVVLTEKLHAFS